jgi:hypothetical protein
MGHLPLGRGVGTRTGNWAECVAARFRGLLQAAGKYYLDLSGDGEDFPTYNLIVTPGTACSDAPAPPPLIFDGRVRGSGPMSMITNSSRPLLTRFRIPAA